MHRGGTKKGPLFPWLLQCVLTYFWEAVADYGGRRGRPRRSCRWKGLAALGVCGGNVQSLIQGSENHDVSRKYLLGDKINPMENQWLRNRVRVRVEIQTKSVDAKGDIC